MTSCRRASVYIFTCLGFLSRVQACSYSGLKFIHEFKGEGCMGITATKVAKSTRTLSRFSVRRMGIHDKARTPKYPRESNVLRFPVPDEKVSWDVDFPEYNPTLFTAPKILNDKPVWADHEISKCIEDNLPLPKYNDFDQVMVGEVEKTLNRKSFMGPYQVIDGFPRNPIGRTGIKGRGCLGRFGPNHAADPIVTRWLRNEEGEVVQDEHGKPVLEFVAILRQDCNEWALPGGMVEAGETVSLTVKREFGEEAMNVLEASDEEKKKIEAAIDDLFKHGKEVYSGYVDDPRNTDNCWMETVAFNFHDGDGTSVSKIKLHAGDDAVGVKWVILNKDTKLYASHSHLVEQVAKLHKASWDRPSTVTQNLV